MHLALRVGVRPEHDAPQPQYRRLAVRKVGCAVDVQAVPLDMQRLDRADRVARQQDMARQRRRLTGGLAEVQLAQPERRLRQVGGDCDIALAVAPQAERHVEAERPGCDALPAEAEGGQLPVLGGAVEVDLFLYLRRRAGAEIHVHLHPRRYPGKLGGAAGLQPIGIRSNRERAPIQVTPGGDSGELQAGDLHVGADLHAVERHVVAQRQVSNRHLPGDLPGGVFQLQRTLVEQLDLRVPQQGQQVWHRPGDIARDVGELVLGVDAGDGHTAAAELQVALAAAGLPPCRDRDFQASGFATVNRASACSIGGTGRSQCTVTSCAVDAARDFPDGDVGKVRRVPRWTPRYGRCGQCRR